MRYDPVNVDLDLKPIMPPQLLYHGTAVTSVRSIMEGGIKPGNRQYVHLSADGEIAMDIGSRHGVPIVLVIRANDMSRDGHDFYLSENGVWLVKYVPMEYINTETWRG
jgi:putative RNA 2'-phosphotransferase